MTGNANMLQWALSFLVVAVLAALFGFGGVAALSIEIARMIFFVFIVLFIAAAALHLRRGKAPRL